jgi:hypothetical protein
MVHQILRQFTQLNAATTILFEVNEDFEKLDPHLAKVYHNLVAKG